MTTPNYRTQLSGIVPRVLKGRLGSRLVATLAYLFEELQEACREAVQASWIGSRDIGPAYDALGPAGNELSLPRYPSETWTQYHDRLQRPWIDWPIAGDEDSILGQLEAAGYPGAQIYDAPRHWTTREPTPWWSQFWVFFPQGTHPVTGIPLVGGFNIGDGTIVGATGITPAELHTIRAIIDKFKPVDWVCRSILFELSGWTIGTDHTVGELDLVVGPGQVVEVGAI